MTQGPQDRRPQGRAGLADDSVEARASVIAKRLLSMPPQPRKPAAKARKRKKGSLAALIHFITSHIGGDKTTKAVMIAPLTLGEAVDVQHFGSARVRDWPVGDCDRGDVLSAREAACG
jgi:hypothetical protein